MAKSNLQSTKKGVVFDWIITWEIGITFLVIIVTLFLNYDRASWTENLKISLLEFIVGLSILMARNISMQIYQMKEGILQTIDVVRNQLDKYNRILKDVNKVGDDEILDSILKITSGFAGVVDNPILYKIVKNELKSTATEFTNMTTGDGFTKRALVGSKDVQQIFSRLMAALSDGDKYDTVTHFDFWSYNMFEKPTDFLNTNIDVAKRKVRIRRVFLVTKKRYSDLDEEEREILNSHLVATKNSGGWIDTKVHFVEEIKKNDNCAIVRSLDGSKLVIEIYYIEDAGKIRRFERLEVVRDQERVQQRVWNFDRLFDGNDGKISTLKTYIEETPSSNEQA